MSEPPFPESNHLHTLKKAAARQRIASLPVVLLTLFGFTGITDLEAQTGALEKTASMPLGLISGVVLEENTGKPIGNARVRVSSPAIDMRSVGDSRAGLYDAQTDADGRFHVQVPKNEKISLNAFAPGFEEAAGLWMTGNWMFDHVPFPANSKQEFTIKLRPALYVAGILVDESGRPFSGARVEATLSFDRGYGYLAFDETPDSGRFQVFDFPLHPSNLTADTNARGQLAFMHQTMLNNLIENVYALSETERTNLRVTLRRGHDVKGTLTSAAGQPVAETIVEAVSSNEQATRKTGVSDTQGRFVIQALPEGEITVRAHALALQQKAQKTIQVAGADAEVNLRLEPLVLTNSPKPVTLFGMKLVAVTEELKSAYNLFTPRGVLILDPGTNNQIQIGDMSQGGCFWMVGNRELNSVREMVAEMLRINAIDPPGDPNEGCRGNIRLVYEYPRGNGTDTEHIHLTDAQIVELKKLNAAFALDRAEK